MVLPLAAGLAAVQIGSGLLGSLKGMKSKNEPTDAERRYSDLAGMLTNPNDPRLKAMISAEQENQQGDFLRKLNTFMEQDRRMRAMGRGSVMGAERQDEGLYNTIHRMNEDAGTSARQQVYSNLGNAMNAQQNLIPIESKRNQAEFERHQMPFKALSTGFGNLAQTPYQTGGNDQYGNPLYTTGMQQLQQFGVNTFGGAENQLPGGRYVQRGGASY